MYECCVRRKSKSFLRTKSSKAKAAGKEGKAEQPVPVDDMSYQQDPLLNHPHFKKIKDLNEGTFGFVQLAKDIRRDEPVSTTTCAPHYTQTHKDFQSSIATRLSTPLVRKVLKHIMPSEIHGIE